MPELTIHDIPQAELDALAARAERHGRSAEEEARHLIHEAAAEEQLVRQLEEARRAEEALRTAERKKEPTSTSAGLATAQRRRYRVVEPTPRKR